MGGLRDKMVGYLFAGQGSQYVGMGKELYESCPESKAVFDTADKVLGFSLSKLCFEGPKEELTKTQNCQPAILTATIAVWEAFCAAGLKTPGYAAGLSLGEYSALVAAEALTFEDAVYLVRRRGEFMQGAALKKPGKMLSVIGMDLESIRKVCADTGTEIANINSPGQIVISGAPDKIKAAEGLSKERGAKMAVVLDVSGAFHSSFMKEAGDMLAQELSKIEIRLPKMPVICNVDAAIPDSTDKIRENLIKQVSSSVLWVDSMRAIISQKVSSFFEFGPGKVLRGLMRRIDADAKVVSIEKKEDIEGVKNAP